MKFEVTKKGAYQLIRIEGPIKLINDLSDLNSLIKKYVNNGDVYIAVNFSEASYLYSGAIAVLIDCYKIIRDRQGDLCIVEPNKGLLDLLLQMNIDSIIRICSDVNELRT